MDHINEEHIKQVLVPDVPPPAQRTIGNLVRSAFAKKDEAIALEDEAIPRVEDEINGCTTRRGTVAEKQETLFPVVR